MVRLTAGRSSAFAYRPKPNAAIGLPLLLHLRAWATVTERELSCKFRSTPTKTWRAGKNYPPVFLTEIHTRLDRFSQHITRIEVHLSDENADKSGESDKRCLIEARLEGRQPEVASDQAATIEGAYSGAAKKLQRALETTLGRLSQLKGSDTIRTGDL